IDLRVADASRAALLVLPMLVQQLAEARQVAVLQRLAALKGEAFHIVQIAQDVRIPGPGTPVLVPQDVAGGPIEAREEQEQVVLEVKEGAGGDAQRLDVHLLVLVKGET